jgi:hypothetical protein
MGLSGWQQGKNKNQVQKEKDKEPQDNSPTQPSSSEL